MQIFIICHCKSCLAPAQKKQSFQCFQEAWDMQIVVHQGFSVFRRPRRCKFSQYVHCKSCLAPARFFLDFSVFRRPGRCNISQYVYCKRCLAPASKIEILVFSGGQGDANFRSMYIVRVASRHREKLRFQCFRRPGRCQFSQFVHCKSCLAPPRKM